MMIRSNSLLRAGVAGLGLLAFAPLAAAQQASGFQIAAPAAAAAAGAPARPAGTLAALPATAEQLTFSGEHAARQFAMTVLADETAQPAKLVLALQSAISVMPETSMMKVYVNDQPAGETRLGTGRAETLAFDIAPGTLVPGLNQIRVVVDQHHRVDCSAAGTYELWTALDPDRSGLSFAGGLSTVTTLDDLPALARLYGGGITGIRGELAAGATAKDTERMFGAIQAAVVKGGFAAPRVSFAGPSTGVALDVALGTASTAGGVAASVDLSGNTVLPSVTLEPGTATRPARLLIGGQTTADLDRNIAAFAASVAKANPAGSQAGLRADRQTKGVELSGGSAVTLRDLGMVSGPFAGRFYRDAVSFRLPSDFYPADYADAALSLNAGYAAGLSAGAQLIVRANDKVVATLPLSSSRRGLIESQKLRVPLGTLRPGHNVISFEANLPNASDAACDPQAQANPPVRFLLSDTSVLTLPGIARIGHVPDLATTMSGGGNADDRDVTLLLPKLDPERIAVAGTFLAKLAASAGAGYRTQIVTTMPHEETRHLIGFGAYSELPAELLSAARVALPDATFAASAASPSLLVGEAKAQDAGGGWKSAFTTDSPNANAPVDGAPGESAARDLGGFVADLPAPGDIISRMEAAGQRLRDGAFELAGFEADPAAPESGRVKLYPLEPDSRLVIAQGAAPVASGGAWTVVTAPEAATLGQSVALLTASDRWSGIGGAVSTMRGEDAAIRTLDAGEERLHETQPRSFSNLRLVVAGWFSRHLESYAISLLLACALLGVTTFLFLRSVGEGRR